MRIACRACPQLVKSRLEVTRVKRRASQVNQQTPQTRRLTPAMFGAVPKNVSSP